MGLFRKEREAAACPWAERFEAALDALADALKDDPPPDTRNRYARTFDAAWNLLRERDHRARAERWRQLDREAGPRLPLPRVKRPEGVFLGVNHVPAESAPRRQTYGRFEHERRR